MPKLTKWAETIVWKGYPECKPEKDNGYLVFLKNRDITDSYNTIEFAVYDIKSGQFRMLEYGHHEDFMLSLICAFAELPTGEIGEEFGFETADYYMKHGTYCIGVTGIPKKYDGLGGVECVKDYACWHEETLTIDEIQGKWRLA